MVEARDGPLPSKPPRPKSFVLKLLVSKVICNLDFARNFLLTVIIYLTQCYDREAVTGCWNSRMIRYCP
jgi:hypothetical protein